MNGDAIVLPNQLMDLQLVIDCFDYLQQLVVANIIVIYNVSCCSKRANNETAEELVRKSSTTNFMGQ